MVKFCTLLQNVKATKQQCNIKNTEHNIAIVIITQDNVIAIIDDAHYVIEKNQMLQ